MVLSLVRTINVDPRGLDGTVETVEFSPDSQFVATGSGDGKVRLWRVGDGALVWESAYWNGSLDDVTGEVEAVYFTPNGTAIAAGGNSDGIKIYRSGDGGLITDLGGTGADGIAFSADGIYFAGGNRGRNGRDKANVRVFDPATWQVRHGDRITHNREVNSVDFTRDGQFVVTGSRDQTVQISQSTDGLLVRSIEAAKGRGSIKSVRVSPDGQYIATGNGEEQVAKVLRYSDGALVATLPQDGRLVEAVAFSVDGQYLAVGGGGGNNSTAATNPELRLYRTSDFSLVEQFTDHEQGIEYIDFSPDGRSLVTASEDGTIKLWQLPIPAVTPAPGGTPGTLPGSDPDLPTDACIPGVRRQGNKRSNRLRGSQGCDVIQGRAGNDVLLGLAGNDTIVGGVGNDRLFGANGSDSLNGGGGNDRLSGGSGNDILRGGMGVDWLWGGAGSDRFVYGSLREGGDRIKGFDAVLDTLDLSRVVVEASDRPSVLSDYVRFRQSGANTVVRVDPNGIVGGAAFKPLITLEQTTASTLSARNVIL